MKPLSFLFIFFFAVTAYGQYAVNEEAAIKVSISSHSLYGSRAMKNKKEKSFYTLYFDTAGTIHSSKRTAVTYADTGPDKDDYYYYKNNILLKVAGYYYRYNDTLSHHATDYFYNDMGQLEKEKYTTTDKYLTKPAINYTYDSAGNQYYTVEDLEYVRTFDNTGRIKTHTQFHENKLRWQRNYTYTDSVSICEQKNYEEDTLYYTRLNTEKIKNGNIIERTELLLFVNPDNDINYKYLFYYSPAGLINKIDRYWSFKDEYFLREHAIIKSESAQPLSQQCINAINNEILTKEYLEDIF